MGMFLTNITGSMSPPFCYHSGTQYIVPQNSFKHNLPNADHGLDLFVHGGKASKGIFIIVLIGHPFFLYKLNVKR